MEDQFKRLTTRNGLSNTIDFGKLDSDRRNASTQMRGGKKLNKFALDLLPESCQGSQEPSLTQRSRLRSSAGLKVKPFNSTFNQYYLNDRYKDLLSIQTAKDGRTIQGRP